MKDVSSNTFLAFKISFVIIGYYVFKEINPKLTINIYEYAHSFFGVDFQSDAIY